LPIPNLKTVLLVLLWSNQDYYGVYHYIELISLAFRSRVLYPDYNGGPPSNFFFF